MKPQLCVCASGKGFNRCCQPYLSGSRRPKTPVQLMRSRFSAFALGGYGAYLLETWLPSSSNGLSEFELSQLSVDWQHLQIIDKSQQGGRGMVEFKATFLDHYGEQQRHHEISQFHRISGHWYYAAGRVLT
ncbi:MAG: SEC-C motif-containing protein [Arenicella sp.]|jgi:SEC-C motif-containing protein